MKQYVSAYAVCPYYRKEENLKIFCEGYLEGMGITLTFADVTECRLHKKYLCQNIERYKKCPICKMLDENYIEK